MRSINCIESDVYCIDLIQRTDNRTTTVITKILSCTDKITTGILPYLFMCSNSKNFSTS